MTNSTHSLLGRNSPPSVTGFRYRLAIIGEAFGRDEAAQNTPFVGISGRLLNSLLSKASLAREACYIGNVCTVQPPNNNLALLGWNSPEVQGSIALLRNELTAFKPNLVLCLGNTALHLFKAGNTAPSIRQSKGAPTYTYPNSVDSWRGSVFSAHANSPLPGTKCLASLHPAFCLRQYSGTTLLMMDIKRAAREACFPELRIPQRLLTTNPTLDDIRHRITDIINNSLPVACDIEGGLSTLSCMSVAISPSDAFIIPFRTADGGNYWQSPTDEATAWTYLIQLLSATNVPKIFQNGLYDCFVLQYGYNIPVANVADDTMLKFWEQYCELEKGLAAQCSILTDEPFYKFERKTEDTDTFYRYCCKDSCVTHELSGKLAQLLGEESAAHYRLNVQLLRPLLYMELRGIRYDTTLAKQRLVEVTRYVNEWQGKLDVIAGQSIDLTLSRDVLCDQARAVMCYKRDQTKPKKEFEADFPRIMSLLRQPTLTNADIGYINTVLNIGLNIKSAKFKTYLYETLSLPPQYDPKTKALTTDYEALLKLQKKAPHPAVEIAIELGSLRTRSQMLAIHADNDGRIRCGYNLVGTETGRITCYTSPTGSGYNLQTIPSDNSLQPKTHPLHLGMRDLFIADEGYYFFQCDLSGADGWTVGAHLSVLGDSTMLDDLQAKLKPAAVICYLLRHGNTALDGKSRAETKELLREVKKEDWDYFACKQGIWGTCYLMGPDKLADVILIQSEGKVTLSRGDVKNFQQAVFTRYDVQRWHRATQRKLDAKPTITAASGHTRRFYGRRDEILGQALAHEPQANTTYATNLAMRKLWTDKENRSDNKSTQHLRIEPLHQVHDALCGQFHKDDTTWAVGRIKSYFDNTLTIAGIPITIPFDGAYGTSWGNLNEGNI